MKSFVYCFSVVLVATSTVFLNAAFAASIALSFDDGMDPDREPRAREWNAQILAALHKANVRAMVFPSLRYTGADAGRALVRDWSKHGHLVGNHTSKHRNLGNPALSLDDFIEDVKDAEAVFKAYPGWRAMLRFPFLKEGETAQKRDGMREWMKKNDYKPAPISVDTSDWYYNRVYLDLQVKADAAKIDALLQAYVRHMVDRANYYDRLAKQVLQRSPAHVLLLHTNAINAASLPKLIAAFREQGWTIVDPEIAFADPLYAMTPATLPAGESIVWSIAKENGVAGLRYPAEDSVYETPILKRLGLVDK